MRACQSVVVCIQMIVIIFYGGFSIPLLGAAEVLFVGAGRSVAGAHAPTEQIEFSGETPLIECEVGKSEAIWKIGKEIVGRRVGIFLRCPMIEVISKLQTPKF